MSAQRPALLVFCREPIPGQVKTRLGPAIGPEAAAALADAFICDALANAKLVRPARIVIAGAAPNGVQESAYFARLARKFGAELTDQGAGALGRRMARALEPYAAAGAVLIGTDTPSLPPALLERNLRALGRRRVVIAPALDGGYYAVGVRGPIPPIFSGIRWGAGAVMAATAARLRRARIEFALGPAWYDVDCWSDLLVLCAHLRMLAGRGRCTCPATAGVLRRLGLLRKRR